MLHRTRILVMALLLAWSGSLWASLQETLAGMVPAELGSVYAPRKFQPVWLDAEGQAGERAQQALALLERAGEDGLSPADYRVASLSHQAQQLQAGNDHMAAARFDIALSQSMLQFALDLATGRLDPAIHSMPVDVRPRRAQLRSQAGLLFFAEDMGSVLETLRPGFPLYGQLRSLLPAYRDLARQYPDAPALPALPAKKLEPGQAWAGVPVVAHWLQILGDLPASTGEAGALLYEGALVEGIVHFQQRHGLTPDGIIGKQTYAALRVPLPERVRQIELAMERMRWIEYPGSQRHLLVNIPQFMLSAFDPVQGPAPVLTMGVVTGKAGKHETPLLAKHVSHVIFSPYWNVPRSIAVKEILPKWREDPHYLASQDMELVDASGHVHAHGSPGDVVLGDFRIRQRPGSHNALGGIKFMFPNDDAIYMHDTPQQTLFNKDRRDFSHGCIRLSNPLGLGLFLLAGEPGWTEERIREQIATGREKHLPLRHKIPVFVTYMTAIAQPDGQASFFADVYGLDRQLSSQLQARH